MTDWQQLTTANASELDVDANGDVAIEIPGAGVWRYREREPLDATDRDQRHAAQHRRQRHRGYRDPECGRVLGRVALSRTRPTGFRRPRPTPPRWTWTPTATWRSRFSGAGVWRFEDVDPGHTGHD